VVSPLKSVTYGQWDARPTVTFPATQRHHPLIDIYYIKSVAELKNVGDAAYAMSHGAQCTQRLAAGRGTDGYQVTGIQLAAATYASCG